ncbi:hypothetical protein AIGOOFII_0659 [Methylobacterium marchantiae]|nr:hypothetical protein AIGOOFII_0659 [Methylobacterium marchantiae]
MPRILSGFAALTLCALPALAADFPEPGPYGPPREFQGERRPPPPNAEFGFERGAPRTIEPCRTVIRRRLTPEGEEVMKRVTVCEERPERLPFEREAEDGYREPRPVPPRLLPPRGIPSDYGAEDGPGRDGDVDGRSAERFSGEDRLSEEPPLDGRGTDPGY